MFMNINLFKLFQIDSWMNRILVYDGSDDQSMLIGELFGTPNHNFMKSISSSEKYIFIDFKRIHPSPVEFAASIKYNKNNPNCQSWLKNNVLISPNHPNLNCSWIITKTFGSFITLEFKFIEVKPINIAAKNLPKLQYLKIA